MTRRDFIFVALVWLAVAWPTEIPKTPDRAELVQTYASLAVRDGHVDLSPTQERWGALPKGVSKRVDDQRLAVTFPAPALLGAMGLGLVSIVDDVDASTITETIRFLRGWIFLPLSLLGFVFLRRVLGTLGVDGETVDLASLVWFAGTAVMQMSAAVVGYQLIACAMLIAIDRVLTAEFRLHDDSPNLALPVAVAGVCAGAVCAADPYGLGYTAALGVFFLGGPLGRHWRSVATFVLTALPGVAMAYAYGNLLFEAFSDVPIPSFDTWPALEALTSSSGGLLVTTPLFAIGFTGLLVLSRQRRARLVMMILVTVATNILTIQAGLALTLLGYAQGALVPSLGVLSISMAVGLDSIRGKTAIDAVVRGLAVSSVLAHCTMRVFLPNTPQAATNPLVDAIPLMVEKGTTPENLGSVWLGLEGLMSLLPFVAIVVVLIVLALAPGFRRVGRKRWALFLGVGLLVAGAHLAVLTNFGGRWTASHREKVGDAMDKINRHNDAFGRRALDAVNQVGGMDQ